MWRVALRHSAIGLEMGVAIAAGYLLGWWLDGKFGTKPYLMLGGLLLGIATAFRAVVRVTMEVRRQEAAEEAAEERSKETDASDNDDDRSAPPDEDDDRPRSGWT